MMCCRKLHCSNEVYTYSVVYTVRIRTSTYQLLSDLLYYFWQLFVPLEYNKKAFITEYNNAARSMDTLIM
jgi:hypothetical protein